MGSGRGKTEALVGGSGTLVPVLAQWELCRPPLLLRVGRVQSVGVQCSVLWDGDEPPPQNECRTGAPHFGERTYRPEVGRGRCRTNANTRAAPSPTAGVHTPSPGALSGAHAVPPVRSVSPGIWNTGR